MNRRLFVPLIVAGMAAASGVASASSSQYWRDNGLMLEVSADPRDGRDLVDVDATRADQLELVALNDTVTLHGMTLHFADGRTMSRPLGFVVPGQPQLVDLPANCEPITSVELDYGNPAYRRSDRTDARLQIIPRTTERRYQPTYGAVYDRQPARFDRFQRVPRARVRVTPARYTPAQYTVVQPRPVTSNGWSVSGRIQASFGF